MTLHYNVIGEDRKRLVYTMGELLECRPVYLKAPGYAYSVDYFTISKDGDVSFDDRADSEEIEQLVEALMERGFQPEAVTKVETEETEEEPIEDATEMDLTIGLPLNGFDVDSLNRLHALIASKRTLLQKALGVELLPVQVTEDRVSFPWFSGELDADHVQAYTSLIAKICEMAKNGKRVTAKDKETGNDKYAFRCWLLRLGFIGEAYKRQRKILLEKLEGSSAFRSGTKKGGDAE